MPSPTFKIPAVSFFSLLAGCGEKPGETWLIHRTEHFDFHYQPGAPAEGDIADLARLMEDYHRGLSKTYGVGFPARIPFYLHGKPLLSNRKAGWGLAHADDSGTIQVLYMEQMKDSRPHELRLQFHRVANHRAPVFFDEGGANIGVSIGGHDFHQLARVRFPDGFPRSLASYIETVTRDYSADEALAAYSFYNFLVETCGESGWGRFYANVRADNYAEQLAALSGKVPPRGGAGLAHPPPNTAAPASLTLRNFVR